MTNYLQFRFSLVALLLGLLLGSGEVGLRGEALAVSAPGESGIELPPTIPPRKDPLDPYAPYRLTPTNPYLVQEGTYQPLGLNLSAETLTSELLAQAGELPFGTYRLAVFQEDFASPDSPNYLKLKSVVTSIRRQGREIMLTLDTSRLVPGLYAAFVRNVVKTVGSEVRYLQLLDNINQRVGVTLADYNEALTLVRTIRELEGGNFQIVLGGIRGVDTSFLQELASVYVLPRVDVIAFNLYPDAEQMEQAQVSSQLVSHSLSALGQVGTSLQSYGKPLFITDLGVSTATSPLGVSQLEQASMLARATLYSLNTMVSAVFYHSLQDRDPTLSNPLLNMGLLTVEGLKKPAYQVIKNLGELLAGSYFIVPFYLYQMSNEFPAGSDPVWAVHLYQPATNRIYFVYWTSVMNLFERRTNLIIYRPGLEPMSLIDTLSGEARPPLYNRGGNILIFTKLPLSHLPVILELKGETPRG